MATPHELWRKETPIWRRSLANFNAVPLAAIGHVLHVDAGHHLEQLARHMGPGSAATRGHVDLARISFGVGDELGNGLGRNQCIHDHDTGLAADARDRRDVAKEIVIELIVERRVDYVWCTDEEERVAVGGRAHDGFGGDIAGGAPGSR
jgi:hypothetical protein